MSLPLRLFPIMLFAVVLEIAWYGLVLRRTYPWREMRASLAMLAMRLPSRLVSAALITPMAMFAWSHRLFTVPLHTAPGLMLLFVGEEFAYYWSHRLSHEIRWMWATHAVHHSPERLHLASAFRLGLTEPVSGAWIVYLPLVLLGLHPAALFAMLGVNLFYQFWLHTDLVGRLGPAEWVLNTPAHHRVHHARNAAYLDRNYGGIVIIWDRLFGTFAEQLPGDTLRFGLVGRTATFNPMTLAFREWLDLVSDVRGARGIGARLKQAFGRPAKAAMSLKSKDFNS